MVQTIPKIGIIVGSDSDLKQCAQGLKWLIKMEGQRRIKVRDVLTMSVHRHTDKLLKELKQAVATSRWNIIISGAGWANHLTGTIDAYLRYTLRDDKVVVIGVAFKDDDKLHTLAAQLSISQVPNTQVVWKDRRGPFIGAEGFVRACKLAVNGKLPQIGLPVNKPVRHRTLHEALTQTIQRK